LSVTFEEADLDLLARKEEIRVETRSGAGDVHKTIVWPLVRDGAVYLRSYRGEAGRWYREAIANPEIVLLFDRRRVPARAIPATDAASIEACSAALREKYPRSYSLGAMLAPAVLGTTVRVEAAPADTAAPVETAAPIETARAARGTNR
jgi:hypothetical protein